MASWDKEARDNRPATTTTTIGKKAVHLLLVEDDTMLAEAVCDAARQIAWTVDHVGDAQSARLALEIGRAHV